MLDLETLSARSHAAILVIAAVKFDRHAKPTELEKMDKFYRKITINSCRECGMHTDQRTVEWWKKQSKEIREEAFEGERITLKQALDEFSKWFQGCDKIWSQGASFDVPILTEAYERCNKEIPWKFWNIRDTRTIYDLANLHPWNLPKDKEHHALYDCWRQVWGVKESIKRLN